MKVLLRNDFLRKKGEQMLKIKNLNHSEQGSGSCHQYRSHDAAPKNGEYTCYVSQNFSVRNSSVILAEVLT